MWNSATVMMIVEGTFATIYMTLVSTLMAYVIGLPAGIALVVTGREGLRPGRAVNRILDVLVNVMRSVPFLILLILASNIRVVQQSRAYVIERLGAFQTVWGVGLHFKIPFIERP